MYSEDGVCKYINSEDGSSLYDTTIIQGSFAGKYIYMYTQIYIYTHTYIYNIYLTTSETWIPRADLKIRNARKMRKMRKIRSTRSTVGLNWTALPRLSISSPT